MAVMKNNMNSKSHAELMKRVQRILGNGPSLELGLDSPVVAVAMEIGL